MNANDILFDIKGLKKNFGKLEVLKGIDTTISKGEVVVVIGPSGSGKSTFIRCLNLLEKPTGGKIVFEGEDITAKGFDANKHREKVGMVFQQFNLFNNLSVLDNITVSLKKVKKMDEKEAEDKAMALLKRVGLEEKAAALRQAETKVIHAKTTQQRAQEQKNALEAEITALKAEQLALADAATEKEKLVASSGK